MDIQKKILIFTERLELYHFIVNRYASEYEVKRYGTRYEWKDRFLEELQVETVLVILDMEDIIQVALERIRKIRMNGFSGILLFISRTELRNLQIEEKIKSIDAGADEYLGYPQTNEEIAASIKALLRRYERKGNLEFQIGGKQFLVNPQGRKVLMDRKELAFTRTEFEILNYLLLHLNRNVSYKQLYEAVWKKEYLHDDMNIMAHIHRIRKKMGDDTKNPRYIQNVYGIGYMMEGE